MSAAGKIAEAIIAQVCLQSARYLRQELALHLALRDRRAMTRAITALVAKGWAFEPAAEPAEVRPDVISELHEQLEQHKAELAEARTGLTRYDELLEHEQAAHKAELHEHQAENEQLAKMHELLEQHQSAPAPAPAAEPSWHPLVRKIEAG